MDSPINTRHNVGLMLGQRRRRWANIDPTLGSVSRLLGMHTSRHNVGLMLEQRRRR